MKASEQPVIDPSEVVATPEERALQELQDRGTTIHERAVAQEGIAAVRSGSLLSAINRILGSEGADDEDAKPESSSQIA